MLSRRNARYCTSQLQGCKDQHPKIEKIHVLALYHVPSDSPHFLTDVAVNPIEDASRPEGAAIHDLGKDATQFAEISKKYGIFLTAFCFEWAST
jgi:hypothetical protein